MREHFVRLFGPPAIRVGGQDKLPEMPVKGFALIGYLAMEGGTHRRDTIAGLLWPDTDDSRRRGSLRTLLYDMNRIAPGLLDVERQTVRIDPDSDFMIDLVEVHRLLESGAPDDRIAAAGFLQGPFMQDIYLDDAYTYESWLTNAQEHWQARSVDLLRSSARSLLMAGRTGEARALFEQLLRIQPWHEETHRGLMRLYAVQGDYASALHQYQLLASAMAEELGLAPDSQSTALQARIRQLRERPPHLLPQQPSPIIGRTVETGQVREMLAGREKRLITLVGPGGIGKTRLAIHVAHGAAYLFLDGVFFVQLASLRPDESFFSQIAQTLKVPNIQKGESKPAVINFLQGHEVLIVLDNFEHLVDQATDLSDMLTEVPGLQLLVTSRQPVAVRWESQYRLDGLSCAPEDSSDPLEYDANRLFVTTARQSAPNFDPKVHWPAIGRVCRQVGGAPLGIELAGGLAASAGPEAIAEQIESSLASLHAQARDIPERQRSLQALFEYSWQLLTQEEQEHLGRLTVFAGGFSPAAAAAVTGSSRRILRRLADKSLLIETDSRYEFHPLIQEFAAGKVAEMGAMDTSTTAASHTGYFQKEMAGILSNMVGISQPEMIERVRLDFANFRTALEHGLLYGEPAGLQPLIEGLTRYFDLLSLFKDGQALMKKAETLVADAGSPVLADIRTAQARFENKVGRFDAAVAIAEGIATDETLGDRTRASAYLEWCWGLWHTTRIAEAEAPLAEGTRLAMRAEAPLLIAHLLRNQGIVAWFQSKFEEARAFTQQAHDLHKEIGDLQGTADSLNNLALISGDQGDYISCMDYLDEAVAIKHDLGDSNGEAITLGNLGVLYGYLGMHEKGVEVFNRGIAISRKVGNLENLGHSLSNRGAFYIILDRFEEAIADEEEALRINRQVGDSAVEGYTLEFLALAYENLENYEKAEEYWEECLALRRRIGLDEMVLNTLGKMAYNAARQGNQKAAAEYLAELESLLEGGNVNNVRIRQTGYYNAFRTLHETGDKRALEYLKKALASLRGQGEKILDEGLRQKFYENVQEHRRLLRAEKEYL